MKGLLPLLLIHFTLLVTAQDVATSKGWLLGIGFSPDIAYRTWKDEGALNTTAGIASRNSMEHPRSAFTTGLYANYILSDRLGIGIGLVYSLKGYNVTTDEVASGWEGRSIYGSEYVDVPITAVIMFGNGRLRSLTNAGIAGNFLLGSHYRYRLEHDDGQTQIGYYSFHGLLESVDLSGVISTGLSYRMNRKLDLRLEPNFRHAFFRTVPRDHHTTLFWSAGINVSAFLDLR